MQGKKYFTVEEANAYIPELTREIRALLELKEKLVSLHAELTPFFEVISSNGGNKMALLHLQVAEEFRERIERIEKRGCLIKGLDPALIDFPTHARW